MKLAGKKAVVTGSSSGLGRAMAIEFARQGADVAIHGRTESKSLHSVAVEIEALGQSCRRLHQDFSEPFDCGAFVNHAVTTLGGVDIWVNNAGADVLTGDQADWSLGEKFVHLMQTDVAATLFLSRAIGARMRKLSPQSGSHSILNIGWDQAWQGMAGDSGQLFATTKGAIMSMTKSLAQSFAPQVRVNCIAPGWIKTRWGEQASEEWTQRAQRESLMNRWGTADDVARTAAFLCSDEANFISGQIVNVNGGFNFQGEQGSA